MMLLKNIIGPYLTPSCIFMLYMFFVLCFVFGYHKLPIDASFYIYHLHINIVQSEVKKCHDIFLEITKNEKDKAAMQIRLQAALGIIFMTTMKAQGLGGVGGGTGLLGGWLLNDHTVLTHMFFY